MYLFEHMIDMGIDGVTWTTPDHRKVAIGACIGNPNVRTMDDLTNNVKIINNISTVNIRLMTYDDLLDLGCNV